MKGMIKKNIANILDIFRLAKNIKKPAAVLFTSIILLAAVPGAPAQGEGTPRETAMPQETVMSQEVKTLQKDETVYVMLTESGNVDFIKVVNRFQDVNGAEITDFGFYSGVTALNADVEPIIEGKAIKWRLGPKFSGDFYYEGALDEAYKNKLPVAFNIAYRLDGKDVPAGELAGKTGRLEIDISLKQNPLCDAAHKNRYMAQIQLPLDLKKTRIIDAGGALIAIAGAKANLSYTVLPGENKNFSLSINIKDFELDSMQITLLDYKTGVIFGQLEDFMGGLDKLHSGMTAATEGTEKFRDGVSALAEGIEKLDSEIGRLSGGVSDFRNGMQSYKKAVEEYRAGFGCIASGAEGLAGELDRMSQGLDAIKAGYGELYAAISQLSAGHAQLSMLAEKLLKSSDPEMQALGQGIIAEGRALEEITSGLLQATNGLSGFSEGLAQFAPGMKTLSEGVSSLSSGASGLAEGYDSLLESCGKLSGGIKELNKGTSEMRNKIKTLPRDAQKMADGQAELADAVGKMKTELNNITRSGNPDSLVSFAGGKTEINSLQFFIKTPAIRKTGASFSTGVQAVEENTPWYAKIWNRIKELFISVNILSKSKL